MNPNYSDEDLAKLVKHELGHIESKTHKHDENFKKGVSRVMAKTRENTFEFSKLKKREYTFKTPRALEILELYGFGRDILFTKAEQEYLKTRSAWSNGRLDAKDCLHLMDILDL